MIGKKSSTARRYPGESNRCRPDKAEARREAANDRHRIYYDNKTPQWHIERLDIKFGVGLGAKRERERLLGRIKNPQPQTKLPVAHPIKPVEPTHEELATAVLPDEIMAEIEAINEEHGKKKIKAKERRAKAKQQ